MRAVGTLILVFGAIAVTFAIYWFNRSVSAAKDARQIYKETGSFSETAKLLYRQQSIPDQYRLSVAQVRYLGERQDEFFRLYGAAISDFAVRLAVDTLRQAQERGIPAPSPSDPKFQDECYAIAAARFGKMWCEQNGIT